VAENESFHVLEDVAEDISQFWTPHQKFCYCLGHDLRGDSPLCVMLFRPANESINLDHFAVVGDHRAVNSLSDC
jgi:hypothetical protein